MSYRTGNFFVRFVIIFSILLILAGFAAIAFGLYSVAKPQMEEGRPLVEVNFGHPLDEDWMELGNGAQYNTFDPEPGVTCVAIIYYQSSVGLSCYIWNTPLER